jgi:hypothetical protein
MSNKNTFKKVKEHGYRIIRNGHDTFAEDICRLLDRLDYLEKERLTHTPVQDKPELPSLVSMLDDLWENYSHRDSFDKDDVEVFLKKHFT